MKLTRLNNIKYCAIIGTWDPPIAEYEFLFRRMVEYCHEAKLVPLVVVVTPHPSTFYAEHFYRDYFDFETKVEWLQGLGIFDLIKFDFEETDLGTGATDFFNELDKIVGISEFWIGELQSFGRDKAGSQTSISQECNKRNIKLTTLEGGLAIKKKKALIYNKLFSHKYSELFEITGYAPTFKITGSPKNFWDGQYLIKNVEYPFSSKNVDTVFINISNGEILHDCKYPWIQIMKRMDI